MVKAPVDPQHAVLRSCMHAHAPLCPLFISFGPSHEEPAKSPAFTGACSLQPLVKVKKHLQALTQKLFCTQATSDKTPFIADLKPSGKYVMEDVHKVPLWACPFHACRAVLDDVCIFAFLCCLLKSGVKCGAPLCRWAASRQS